LINKIITIMLKVTKTKIEEIEESDYRHICIETKTENIETDKKYRIDF